MSEEENEQELIEKCMAIVKCDTARISSHPHGKIYLVIGFKKNTKDVKGAYWTNNIGGERIDFEYTEEHCVASGHTEDELLESVKKYVKLSSMSWEEYFALPADEQKVLLGQNL